MRALQKHAFRSRGSDVSCEEQGKILASKTMQLNYNEIRLWVCSFAFYSAKSTTFAVQSFSLSSNVSLLVWLKDLEI